MSDRMIDWPVYLAECRQAALHGDLAYRDVERLIAEIERFHSGTGGPALGLQRALNDVLHERERQDAKWGQQTHHPMEWLSILGEEQGEACQAANEAHWSRADWAAYRKELVEVAAVAVAAVECLDRHPQP